MKIKALALACVLIGSTLVCIGFASVSVKAATILVVGFWLGALTVWSTFWYAGVIRFGSSRYIVKIPDVGYVEVGISP